MSLLYKSTLTYDPKDVHIIPVGSIEQHDDLPLGTDSIIAECISWNVKDSLEEKGVKSVVLPTVYYGFSPEWTNVKGTISLSSTTFCFVIKEIIASLAKHGVEKIVVINGHGGNSELIRSCAREMVSTSEDNFSVMAVDYFRYLKRSRLGHGCGVERSILRLCGIEASETPLHPILKDFDSKILHSSTPVAPVSIIPPESRQLDEREFNRIIDDITNDIITFVTSPSSKGFP